MDYSGFEKEDLNYYSHYRWCRLMDEWLLKIKQRAEWLGRTRRPQQSDVDFWKHEADKEKLKPLKKESQ